MRAFRVHGLRNGSSGGAVTCSDRKLHDRSYGPDPREAVRLARSVGWLPRRVTTITCSEMVVMGSVKPATRQLE
jgi:hypothetical protein